MSARDSIDVIRVPSTMSDARDRIRSGRTRSPPVSASTRPSLGVAWAGPVDVNVQLLPFEGERQLLHDAITAEQLRIQALQQVEISPLIGRGKDEHAATF